MKNNIKRIIGLCLFVFIGYAPSGCGQTEPKVIENWKGGLITEAGTYTLADSGIKISVWIDQKHIVHFSIADPSSKPLFVSSEQPSAFSRWHLYFDQNGWLWFSSGDIGEFVIKKAGEQVYQSVVITGQPDLIKGMPDEFWNRLGESTKRDWAKFRK